MNFRIEHTNKKRVILILNYHDGVKSIIDELRLEMDYMNRENLELYLVKCLDNTCLPKNDDERISLQLFDIEDVGSNLCRKVNINDVDTAVVLSDKSKGEYVDYNTILLAKHLAFHNPRLHIIVELQDSTNISLLGLTNVGDVICIEEISEKLLSNSSIIHGFSQMYMHLLLNYKQTNSIFSVEVPQYLVNKSFRYAEEYSVDLDQDIILIGYITQKEHIKGQKKDFMIINPDTTNEHSPEGKNYTFKENDKLIYIAYEKPYLSNTLLSRYLKAS